MKIFTVLMIVILNYFQLIPALLLSDPIVTALGKTLNRNEIPTLSMCQDNFKEIENLKTESNKLRVSLIPIIKEKLSNPQSTDGLKQLIKQYCCKNEDIRKIGRSLSANVKSCFITRNKRISKKKLKKIKAKAICAMCANIKAMIKSDIIDLQQEGPSDKNNSVEE